MLLILFNFYFHIMYVFIYLLISLAKDMLVLL